MKIKKKDHIYFLFCFDFCLCTKKIRDQHCREAKNSDRNCGNFSPHCANHWTKKHFKIKIGILNSFSSFSRFLCSIFRGRKYTRGGSFAFCMSEQQYLGQLASDLKLSEANFILKTRYVTFYKAQIQSALKRGNFLEHFYFNVLLINI